MKHVIFIIRSILWVFFCLLIPIYVIANNYKLTNDSPSKYTVWALIIGVLLFIFFSVVLGYVLKLLEFSMLHQVLSGVKKVILPLLIIYISITAIVDSADVLKHVLKWIIFSEVIAIPINPFPNQIHKVKLKRLKEACTDV